MQRDQRSGDSEPLTVPSLWHRISQLSTVSSSGVRTMRQFPMKKYTCFVRRQVTFSVYPLLTAIVVEEMAASGTVLGFREYYEMLLIL